jgi:hypothetical protein
MNSDDDTPVEESNSITARIEAVPSSDSGSSMNSDFGDDEPKEDLVAPAKPKGSRRRRVRKTKKDFLDVL